MRLVKIQCLGNVGWDDAIVPPSFIDAVQLDCQQNRDAVLVELAGQSIHGGSAPAVSQQNDSGTFLFFIRELTITISVQPLQDLSVRLSCVTILKDHCVDSRILPRESFDDLHLNVAIVITANETSDKPDDDNRRGDEFIGG